jgi:hypothetical protein
MHMGEWVMRNAYKILVGEPEQWEDFGIDGW